MPGLDLLLRLLIAHVLGDFLLQPGGWVRERAQKHFMSKALYLHGVLHGVLAMLAFGDLSRWPLALLVAITHIAIDLLKSYKDPRSTTWFVIDQALHALVLFGIWAWSMGYAPGEDLRPLWHDERTLAVILAAVMLTRPTGILIAVFTGRWSAQLGDRADNLPSAGMWIGIIERLLILVFALGGEMQAVGFLLAAKSVFRFGDLSNDKDRMRTEYVLIGTLLSFGIAIGVSLWARSMIG